MKLTKPLPFSLLLFPFLFLFTSSVSASPPPLDPAQLRALESLHVPTSPDPCSPPPPTSPNATLCDSAAPFRHLLSLRLPNCSGDAALSFTALKSLSTLQSLQFLDCPISLIRFPPELAASLRSFTCIRSLRHLTGVWLSRLRNLSDLTVSGVSVSASGPYVILGNMKSLISLTISHANLTGFVPKHLNPNLTHLDFSGNKLRGKIPNSITLLENLQILDLSFNSLNGEIPISIGDLISLQNLSIGSNSLTGPIPGSLSAIPGLIRIDLGSNRLNGTIPRFVSEMRSLRYLNLENNRFRGVIPFNETFIKRLEVFKIQGNGNLCYNRSALSSKLKLGIAPCDKYGFPIVPPPAMNKDGEDSVADDGGSDYYENNFSHKEDNHRHGPNKVVLGVAIALSSLVFIIVFSVLLSKCCL